MSGRTHSLIAIREDKRKTMSGNTEATLLTAAEPLDRQPLGQLYQRQVGLLL